MSDNELVRLCYASTATFDQQRDATGIEPNVARILMQSRRNNARDHVGGVLHFGDGYFFQCLEGERDAVDRTYHRIGGDRRHRDVKMLSLVGINERLFKDWSMKYVAVARDVEALLKSTGRKRFDPYAFNNEFIDRLLAVCVGEKDPTEKLETGQKGNKSGLFGRLFGGGRS